ncbi:MAG TPA: SDR family oxidoreductase [Noviherbaspirillum sp.]
MKKLSGKTALITGGNSGIGLATARLFLQHGARVAITGQSQDSLEQAGKVLGNDVLALQSNAGKLEDIDSLMEQVRTRFGSLDVLFVNAGNSRPAPFEQVTESQFDDATAVLYKGAFFTIQKALPLLSQGASVIVTTSISNQKGSPNFSVYASCKAALRSLVQTLSLELVDRGIRVNAISPGPIDTPGFGRYWGAPPEVVQAAKDEFVRKSPMKRFGESDEVAQAVLFLASEDSSYIVGTEIVVDGAVTLPLR